MVDLAIVPGQVKEGAAGLSKVRNRTRESILTTEDVDAGELVDLSSTPGRAKLAVAGDVLTANVAGMATNSAASGQPVDVMESGVIDVGVGANILPGVPYFLSVGSPGGVAPLADITTGNVITFVGMGLDNNLLQLDPQFTGQVVP